MGSHKRSSSHHEKEKKHDRHEKHEEKHDKHDRHEKHDDRHKSRERKHDKHDKHEDKHERHKSRERKKEHHHQHRDKHRRSHEKERKSSHRSQNEKNRHYSKEKEEIFGQDNVPNVRSNQIKLAQQKLILSIQIRNQVIEQLNQMKKNQLFLQKNTVVPFIPTSTTIVRKKLDTQNITSIVSQSNITGMTNPSAIIKQPRRIDIEGPRPLLFDQDGREIDENGNLIVSQTKSSLASIKANMKMKSDRNVKLKPKMATNPKINPFFDTRLNLKNKKLTKGIDSKKQKNFNFAEPGKYISEAEQFRENERQHELLRLKTELEIDGEEQEIEFENSLKIKPNPIPEIEWWDEPLLKSQTYDKIPNIDLENFNYKQLQSFFKMMSLKDLNNNNNNNNNQENENENEMQTESTENLSNIISEYQYSLHSELQKSHITNLVQHPISVTSPIDIRPIKELKPLLTKQEMRKLRTMRRLEREKETQDKIRLGLLPPPKPKVKLSNFMRVLGQEAIQDPTKVDLYVRKEIEERQRKHALHNKKLTKEERLEKKKRKLSEDTSAKIHIAVFHAKHIRHPKTKYKIDVNAQQRNLSGCCIFVRDMNLIVVEGGPKNIKFYKNLLLKRIKWKLDVPKKKNPEDDSQSDSDKDDENSDFDSDSDSDTDSETEIDGARPTEKKNFCVLLWEGSAKKPSFKRFAFHSFENERIARHYLERHQVPHYIDLCKNYKLSLNESII
ncbi:u4/u6-associated RNA splicing factor-related [Anaeramoeba ignava]|uniref:U4/u6-associated RNA splicing factor-related n=1 Tax=Anaeramoeba ignava TaxID=1746090 RepID=A0A9Q0R8T2_ANAIG|nr:u4/u6-associated RNA splicing factor-related [Anaeramoeba ignava]